MRRDNGGYPNALFYGVIYIIKSIISVIFLRLATARGCLVRAFMARFGVRTADTFSSSFFLFHYVYYRETDNSGYYRDSNNICKSHLFTSNVL